MEQRTINAIDRTCRRAFVEITLILEWTDRARATRSNAWENRCSPWCETRIGANIILHVSICSQQFSYQCLSFQSFGILLLVRSSFILLFYSISIWKYQDNASPKMRNKYDKCEITINMEYHCFPFLKIFIFVLYIL